MSGKRDRFDDAHDEWYSKAGELWRPWPDDLFHYTSGAGLLGIVSSGEIWGGNYSFMNDRSEFIYATDMFRGVIGDMAGKQRSRAARELLDLVLGSDEANDNDMYVVSFCEEPDLLSQWRGYGAQATRYCLRIDGSKIDDYMWERSPPLPVTYDASKQRETLRALIDSHLSVLATARRKRNVVHDGALSIYTSALLFLATFKDPSFHEEKEWRHVFLVPESRHADISEHLRFGNTNGVVRPFLPLLRAPSGGRLPLAEVIAGSGLYGQQAIRSARLMLDRYGYSDVPVRRSAVPLAL